MAVGTERQFVEFVAALDLAWLAEDSRFINNAARVINRQTLNDLLTQKVARMSADEIESALLARKVPFGFVNDMPGVFQQPQCVEQLFDGGGGVRSVALSGDIKSARRLSAPPHLDEHREEILHWLAGK